MQFTNLFYWPGGFDSRLLYVFVQPHHLIRGMIFFVSIIAIVLVFMLFYLVRRSRKSQYRNQLRQQYSEFLSYLAISESVEELQAIMNEPAWKEKLANWLNNPFARKILIRELVATVKNMSGAAADNACWFYANAGLDKDSSLRLKHGHWHVKARALQELSHLKQKQYTTRIYRLTNNRNEFVRNEARIAIVKLTGFEGLRFLDILTYPLTEWEQMSLLHELSQQQHKSLTEIDRWLHSSNSSVVEFSLRLIETYKIYDLHDEVVKCLVHPDKNIRKIAIQTLKEICGANTASVVAERLEAEDEEMQLFILEALQQIGTEKENSVLSKYLFHSRDDFKVAAAKAIGNIDVDGWSYIEHKINPGASPWNVLLPYLKQESLS